MAAEANVKADRTGHAVLAIVVGVLALSFGDALIKLTSADVSFWQLYVMRSVVAVPLLLAIIAIGFRGLCLRPKRLGWTMTRSLVMALNWVFFYAALPYVPLSIAAAAYYTSPLFITLFAGLFVGDRVRVIDWFAVVLGFVGVLIILRPDANGVNAFALLPIVAAILYAIASILTRTKCADEEPLVLSLALLSTFFVVGAVVSAGLLVYAPEPSLQETYPFLLGPWASVGSRELLVIAALGAIIVIGSISAAFAYQNGRLPVVATFDYAYLAFATVWGFVFFRETPDMTTGAGMLLIVVAGLMAVRR